MTELSNREAQLLAFALFSTGMRIGPDVFDTIHSIAHKAGVMDKLALFTSDWTKYNQTIKEADDRGVGLFQGDMPT